MADNDAPNPWAAPGSDGNVPSWDSPSSGTPQSSASTPSGGSGSVPPPPGVNVWKPGIINLRPLSFGELLEGAFKSIRHNPKAMFLVPAGVLLLGQVVITALTWEFWGNYFTALNDPTVFDNAQSADDVIETLFGGAGALVGLGVATIVQLIVTTFVTAIVTFSTARSVLGERATPGEVAQRAASKLGTLLLLALIFILAYYGSIALLFGLAFAAGGGGGVALMILGFLAWIPLAIWIATKLVIAVPALVLEDIGAIGAIRRSWSLTTGRFWPIFGVVLVAGIIVGVASQIIAVPFGMIGGFAAASDPAGGIVAINVSTGISSFLASLLTAVFMGAIAAVVYTDQRMRREGFDLDLQRAAQERQGR